MMSDKEYSIKLFENFDGSKEQDIVTYFERFELYCETMGIKEERWPKVLLSSIGGETYTKLKRLVTPKEVRGCTYAVIKATLEEHFSPRHLIIMERHTFRY